MFDFEWTMRDISTSYMGTNDMKAMMIIDGGVTAPQGFKAAGVHAGIKAAKPDMAMIVSSVDSVVAGTFTTNKVQAAPVRICRDKLAGGTARAIVINSGSANACTGPQGWADAKKTVKLTANELDVPKEQVFVCSTGTIGKPLPMEKIETGIKRLAELVNEDGGGAAAGAILTTDTVIKQVAVETVVNGVPVRVGGMAKGAGMIEPNMATMLSFITTDALVDRESLQECLAAAVNKSFNSITVDGDQSTNDTVLMMANGAAGNECLNSAHDDWMTFVEAVEHVTHELALMIVKDGEGATRFVTVTVKGAASEVDADVASRAVCNSLLVKTAWTGGDPNWGRIIAAVGYSGAEMRDDTVDITFDDVPAVRKGQLAEGASLEDLEAVFARKAFEVVVDLHTGDKAATVYTCDCSQEYVRINSEYMT